MEEIITEVIGVGAGKDPFTNAVLQGALLKADEGVTLRKASAVSQMELASHR